MNPHPDSIWNEYMYHYGYLHNSLIIPPCLAESLAYNCKAEEIYESKSLPFVKQEATEDFDCKIQIEEEDLKLVLKLEYEDNEMQADSQDSENNKSKTSKISKSTVSGKRLKNSIPLLKRIIVRLCKEYSCINTYLEKFEKTPFGNVSLIQNFLTEAAFFEALTHIFLNNRVNREILLGRLRQKNRVIFKYQIRYLKKVFLLQKKQTNILNI